MHESLYRFERRFWREGVTRVAGVDEVGRGPLAGPVVACAVILPPRSRIRGLKDSKRLSAPERESLFVEIVEWCPVGLGLVSEKVIDEINILQATRAAMRQALAALPEVPEAVLVDGRMRLDWPGPTVEIIRGDALSASIAAASIVAKVVRDQMMLAYHEAEPFFSFHLHKGYGTVKHLELIRERGPSPFHRLSFRPIRQDPQGVLL